MRLSWAQKLPHDYDGSAASDAAAITPGCQCDGRNSDAEADSKGGHRVMTDAEVAQINDNPYKADFPPWQQTPR